MGKIPGLQKKITLVVLGRSGSGKGTQADFLVRFLGGKNVGRMETGKFLRDFIKKDNVTALIGRKRMGDGRLFPSWFAVYGWLRQIIEHGDAARHLLFDGAPRTVWQARLTDEVIQWHGRPQAVCIYIDVPERIAIRRLLLRKRADDKPGAIKNRMEFFRRSVVPVLRYYRKTNRLIHIDGTLSPEDVFAEIQLELTHRLKGLWPRQVR